MKEYNLDWVSKLSGIKNYLNNYEFILLMFTGSSWYHKSVMQSSDLSLRMEQEVIQSKGYNGDEM